MDASLAERIVNATPDALVAVVGLLGVWLVGNRLSARWDVYKKQRELDLQAAEAFYRTYGEFFAVWKLWHAPPHHADGSNPPLEEVNRDEDRLALLRRASASEGQLEALLVKLAVERALAREDLEALSRFRQGFQCLRESIEEDTPLRVAWSTDDLMWKATRGADDQGLAYAAFKELAVSVGWIVCSRKSWTPKTSGDAFADLREMTSTEVRTTWYRSSLPSLPASRRWWQFRKPTLAQHRKGP